jgi:hypothetical protein
MRISIVSTSSICIICSVALLLVESLPVCDLCWMYWIFSLVVSTSSILFACCVDYSVHLYFQLVYYYFYFYIAMMMDDDDRDNGAGPSGTVNIVGFG